MKAAKLVLISLLFWATALRAAETAKYAEISAKAIPDLPSKAWGSEHQYIQADKEGRVFLLHKGTLGLYQISSSGELATKGRLVRDDSVEIRRNVHSVSLSPSGDAWVLLSFPNFLYVFRGERMTALEVPWQATGVLANGTEPLVAVMPTEMNTTAPTILQLDKPPLLLQYDGKRWNAVAEGRFPGDRPEGVGYLDHLWGEYNVFLGSSPEHRLWMADEFAYRLRRFSPSFVLQDEITVGTGKVEWKERPAEERKAVGKLTPRIGSGRQSMGNVRAEPVFRAMTVGRDGVVYLLVQTEQGLALDRFHPALLSLDRVLLKGLSLQSWAKPTMALGIQGLLIAPLNARDGIWQIDAETLDQAEWQPVPGAMLNGQALVLPPKDEEKVTKRPDKQPVEGRKVESQN